MARRLGCSLQRAQACTAARAVKARLPGPQRLPIAGGDLCECFKHSDETTPAYVGADCSQVRAGLAGRSRETPNCRRVAAQPRKHAFGPPSGDWALLEQHRCGLDDNDGAAHRAPGM